METFSASSSKKNVEQEGMFFPNRSQASPNAIHILTQLTQLTQPIQLIPPPLIYEIPRLV